MSSLCSSCCSYWTNLKILVCAGVMAHHVKKVGGEVDLFAKIRDNLENVICLRRSETS